MALGGRARKNEHKMICVHFSCLRLTPCSVFTPDSPRSGPERKLGGQLTGIQGPKAGLCSTL